MGRQRNDLIDRAQYVALRLVSAALHCFPVDTNIQSAKLLGDLVYRVDRKHRERAMKEGAMAFMTKPVQDDQFVAAVAQLIGPAGVVGHKAAAATPAPQ